SEGVDVTRTAVSALDRLLSGARYLGDSSKLESLAADVTGGEARPALDAAVAAARALAPLANPAPASAQVQRLLAFWTAHLRPLNDDDPRAERDRRVRAALTGTLEALLAVHTTHDDPDWTIDQLALEVRRWIEEQTFERERRPAGIHLVDADAARYGDFDD